MDFLVGRPQAKQSPPQHERVEGGHACQGDHESSPRASSRVSPRAPVARYESIITAIIGGLLGIGVGLLFAFLVTQSLGDLGLGFKPPPEQLAIFLVLAVAVGIIAAVAPARRGARLQVLEALHAE
jgi:predicted lipid-binding transport protein (Tim44 family)